MIRFGMNSRKPLQVLSQKLKNRAFKFGTHFLAECRSKILSKTFSKKSSARFHIHTTSGLRTDISVKAPIDHNFLIFNLERYGFSKNFIPQVNILLRNKASYVLNGATTTKYFLLGRGTHQGDPISPLLFLLALEILFHFTKSNPEIKGLSIFEHCYI